MADKKAVAFWGNNSLLGFKNKSMYQDRFLLYFWVSGENTNTLFQVLVVETFLVLVLGHSNNT